jgi:hypothetical protein
MERKMMLILPKRVAASSMCEKGLWRIFLAQSTGATFPDNGAKFLSSWCQIEVNCCSTSSYGRNVLEKMGEEARKKKEDLLLPASEQMYVLMGTEDAFRFSRQEEAMAHSPKRWRQMKEVEHTKATANYGR